jgi:aminopeptidase N
MNKSSLLFFAVLILTPIFLVAFVEFDKLDEVESSIKKEYYKEHLNNSSRIFYVENEISPSQKKVDILHYDLFFDLYPGKKEFKASATLTGKVKVKGLKEIDINFYDNFDISEVMLNGMKHKYINENNILKVFSDPPVDTFSLKIDYSGTPERAGFAGFVFGKINDNSLVYTLSEPYYASSWFPCNDFPSDKALLDIRIRNDSSLVSVSNGSLINIEQEGDKKTYHWKSVYPISTYLIAIYSSAFKHFDDKYISLDKADTMSIDYYVLPKDLENAKKDFVQHPDMIRFFAETFGEYPFIKEKYGIAEFLWQLGAMEHQTITGVASNMISGKNFYFDIYIHELAHQWWGDAVGPKSWKDIWLNEGFASYCEALFYEFRSGKSALKSTMLSKKRSDFTDILGEPGSFLFTSTVYNKGAWVLHMLRWELGDDLFFNSLRKYYEKYKYSTASTEDFKKVCEDVSGKDLTKFFDQWVYGKGIIKLQFDWTSSKNNNEFETLIDIEQVQSEYDEYDFPLEIGFKYEDRQTEYHRVNINSTSSEFNFKSKQKPVEVTLDPNDWLLMTSERVVDD